jgi:hypothetical protein
VHLGKRNGWTIAEQAGDATPDRTQRLLNHASWDTCAAVSVTRRFVIGGLDGAGGTRGLRIGFRQWIPREQIEDPAVRERMGLPDELAFATKGELAVQILADASADGMVTDFVCGDEVYGSCPVLRCYLEDHAQGHVLRVAKASCSPTAAAAASAAPAWTSPRSGCIPRSPGTPCRSWPRSPSASSPPPRHARALTPKPRRQPAPMTSHQPIPA